MSLREWLSLHPRNAIVYGMGGESSVINVVSTGKKFDAREEVKG